MENPSSQADAVTKMTDGQIEELQGLFGDVLRRHREEFTSRETKLVIEQEDRSLQSDFLAVVRRYFDNDELKTVVRVVTVNRRRAPQQMLDATGCTQYIDEDSVAVIPRSGTGVEENVVIEFFKLDCRVNDDVLANEYRERGLVPDPYAVAAVNEDDSTFADKYPNGTHYKDANGQWCYLVFSQNGDENEVNVGHCSSDWFGFWWFGGVRPSVPAKL